jgi:hypothetical protein
LASLGYVCGGVLADGGKDFSPEESAQLIKATRSERNGVGGGIRLVGRRSGGASSFDWSLSGLVGLDEPSYHGGEVASAQILLPIMSVVVQLASDKPVMSKGVPSLSNRIFLRVV